VGGRGLLLLDNGGGGGGGDALEGRRIAQGRTLTYRQPKASLDAPHLPLPHLPPPPPRDTTNLSHDGKWKTAGKRIGEKVERLFRLLPKRERERETGERSHLSLSFLATFAFGRHFRLFEGRRDECEVGGGRNR